MPLTQREALQLGLLLLCVPAQYLLSGNVGTGTGKSQAFLQLVGEIKHLRDAWFRLESWKLRWIELVTWLLKGIFPPGEYTSRDGDVGPESPAVEVLEYREHEGYFATSLEVRMERPPHLRYRVGQVVRHRTYRYKGVIIGWDLYAKAPEIWLERMYSEIKMLEHWPHYAILIDERDRPGQNLIYVVQEDLELLKNTEVQHPDLKKIFQYFDGAQYIPRSKLKALYPKD